VLDGPRFTECPYRETPCASPAQGGDPPDNAARPRKGYFRLVQEGENADIPARVEVDVASRLTTARPLTMSADNSWRRKPSAKDASSTDRQENWLRLVMRRTLRTIWTPNHPRVRETMKSLRAGAIIDIAQFARNPLRHGRGGVSFSAVRSCRYVKNSASGGGVVAEGASMGRVTIATPAYGCRAWSALEVPMRSRRHAGGAVRR